MTNKKSSSTSGKKITANDMDRDQIIGMLESILKNISNRDLASVMRRCWFVAEQRGVTVAYKRSYSGRWLIDVELPDDRNFDSEQGI
jgi:hypothetical protein